jgi:phage gp29-like protein
MTTRPAILDQWGRPIERRTLTQEVAAATVTGVRSPITGYPGDGLDPVRLATILREADQGDPLRYLELAETIEERDLHYVGVLGTRRRSVAQIEISVDAASDAAEDVDRADMMRDWLTRDELSDELFDILDAIGKGYSFTEIMWDTSEGQWRPARLEWRDPRWFRPARYDLTTPLMLGEHGEELELPGGKFVQAVIRAKSGLPVRSGLARMVTWAWMFKAFTQRDWAIFTQTYGQPVRIGKYGPGATKDDRDTLYRAVANIAGDCGAIMPAGMDIEFVEAANLGTGHSNYMERADWLDRQVSKGVLGQTTTTDAISGGHAVSREHRQVQEDIERADAKALSAVINRDLVRVWMDLEFGPQKAYPKIRIARPDEEDLAAFSSALNPFIDRGLRVSASEVRDRFGLADPDEHEEVLVARASPAAPSGSDGVSGDVDRDKDRKQALHQQQRAAPLADEIVAESAMPIAVPAVAELVGQVRGIVARAGSLEAAERLLEETASAMRTPPALTAAMRQAMLLAWLMGETSETALGDA